PEALPSIPEEGIDLLCLALAAWGFWLRVRVHWRPAARRRPAAILGDGFVGTLLIGAGLSLMLHDLVVLASFALFFGLWAAVCALARPGAGGAVPGPGLPAPLAAAQPLAWPAPPVTRALRREADVLGLSLVA